MNNFLTREKNNVFAVVTQLLKSLDVKVSKGTVRQNLIDHPSYPSLFSVSECLKDWSVTNLAYQIDKKDYDSTELHYPFIAHSNVNGGYFMLIDQIVDGNVIYADEKGTQQRISEEQFIKIWSGVALHATANEKSGEVNYKSNVFRHLLNSSRIPLLIFITVATILFSLDFQTLNFGFSLLLFVKLIGVAISIFLLIHSIDANNPLIKNLCSLGNQNDCNAVLKSDAAKIASWLTWSEVGFFYFVGSCLSLLINQFTLPIVIWLNIAALPYIVYSLSYQYKNRNWCVLCCAIQGILGVEFLNNIAFNNSVLAFNQIDFDSKPVVTIFLAFSIPIAIWSFIKPFLTNASQLSSVKKQLNKFKYDSGLFEQALIKQPRFAVPDELMPLVLGNPDAPTTITMVTNPFCGPCGKAHEIFDKWLKTTNDIKLKIVFATADHDDDERTKMSRHVTALSFVKAHNILEDALNDWYRGGFKNYANWATKYPIGINEEIKTVTQKHKAWCKLADIDETPTILINGYKLPEPYRLEDMKYLLS